MRAILYTVDLTNGRMVGEPIEAALDDAAMSRILVQIPDNAIIPLGALAQNGSRHVALAVGVWFAQPDGSDSSVEVTLRNETEN